MELKFNKRHLVHRQGVAYCIGAVVKIKICEQCKNEFTPVQDWLRRRYCSIQCGYLAKRRDVLFFCEECKQEKLRRGKEKNKRFCSRECMLVWRSREVKVGNIDLSGGYRFGRGEDNPNWKGGVSPINEMLRKTKEQKAWGKAVFKRDNYTCQFCGKRGGYLEADHIKQFALYPDLRTVLSNGRTLCLDCHRTTFVFYKNQYKEGIIA